MDKRVKTLASLDDVLLAPGLAVQTIEALREQVYHMQKKLRKRNRQIARYREEDHMRRHIEKMFDGAVAIGGIDALLGFSK